MHDRLNEAWWKRSADESPDAIAFVCEDNRFLYVNRAWSILTGYAAAELVGRKRWQDITEPEDIGADQASVEAVRNAGSEEFYLEKTYRRKDGTTVPVGIYVHRHPPFGPHEGYVVFARPSGTKELAHLQRSYIELSHAVTVLEQQQAGFARLDERITGLASSVAALQQTMLQLIGAKGAVSITGGVGDGHRAGRDANSSTILVVALAAMLGLGVLAIGGKFYIDAANGRAKVEAN